MGSGECANESARTGRIGVINSREGENRLKSGDASESLAVRRGQISKALKRKRVVHKRKAAAAGLLLWPRARFRKMLGEPGVCCRHTKHSRVTWA
eukprot:1259299-Pleurochrysis_carterae.AAC.1